MNDAMAPDIRAVARPTRFIRPQKLRRENPDHCRLTRSSRSPSVAHGSDLEHHQYFWIGVHASACGRDMDAFRHAQEAATGGVRCCQPKEKAMKAVRRIKDFKPYKIANPIRLEVRFKNYRPSEVLSYLSIVERTDAHSIRFTGKDIVEVSKFLSFINTYELALEP
jgi:hypothetical protein